MNFTGPPNHLLSKSTSRPIRGSSGLIRIAFRASVRRVALDQSGTRVYSTSQFGSTPTARMGPGDPGSALDGRTLPGYPVASLASRRVARASPVGSLPSAVRIGRGRRVSLIEPPLAWGCGVTFIQCQVVGDVLPAGLNVLHESITDVTDACTGHRALHTCRAPARTSAGSGHGTPRAPGGTGPTRGRGPRPSRTRRCGGTVR